LPEVSALVENAGSANWKLSLAENSNLIRIGLLRNAEAIFQNRKRFANFEFIGMLLRSFVSSWANLLLRDSVFNLIPLNEFLLGWSDREA
jgi:hypothetical protein